MRRWPGTAGLALALLLAATTAQAAEVAVVKSSDTPAWRPVVDALRRTASAHSVAEFDLRGDRGEGERILASLKGRSVIVVAMGPLAAQLARELTPELPLVYCMVQDPAKAGLQDAPNTMGVAFTIPVKNQLAAFRQVYPRGTRIGVVYSPDNLGRLVQEAQKATSVVRLILVEKAVASEREVPQAIRSLLQGPDAVDALWLPPDPVLLGEEARRFVLSEALKAGKPVFSFSPSVVAEGALASNGPDFVSIGEQAGELVNRMASGERGGRGEMMIPRAELVINGRIAGKLKIEIPPEALRAAKKVL